MPLNISVKNIVSKKLEEYEGRYSYMYLDSKGKVTIGIGHLVDDKYALADITMYKTKNNTLAGLASLQEKQDEYDRIIKQRKGYRASWYKQYCTLVMKDADINAQRNEHIITFYNELSSLYKKSNGYSLAFDNMPEEVQQALFDMIFNLGKTRLSKIFPQFNDAIKKAQWDEAAKQSNRPDVSAARNSYVKGLLNKAHVKVASAVGSH